MPRLVLVLSDLPAARLSERAREALPRLPRLEQWLARGHSERATGGWRHWLLRNAGQTALRSMPLASIAAAALSEPPDARPVWFATPVHWVAGLDTVRVHPAGVLQLAWDEQQALEQDFAVVFAGSGWSLRATGRRELLLAGGTPQLNDAVSSHDPLLWLGADPRAGLPGGPGADGLRRLGAEMEMWLHEHPVNRQRLARRQLPVSALWLWGGGAPASAAPGSAAPDATGAVAWADDVFVDGLARLGGYTVEPLPERWPQSAVAVRKRSAELLAVCRLGEAPDEHALESLEKDWIAPAFDHWRGGDLQRATLLAGEHAVTLERSPLRTFWRSFARPRPWWETLLPC